VIEPPAEPREPYSPHYRTALVLTGVGTAGAYHAGVLRAFDEAGVKIDLVAGRGIGAVSALFAAVEGAPRLWEPDGIWRRRLPSLYPWRPIVRLAAWALGASLLVLVLPLLVLGVGLLVYPIGFLLRVAGLDAGRALVAAYASWLGAAFEPSGLPTILPRLVVLALVGVLAALVVGAVRARQRGSVLQRERAPFWWLAFGAPLSSGPACRLFRRALWRVAAGLDVRKAPSATEFSRRYTELLGENLGQRGFRELLLVTHDLDTRLDLVFALVADRHRRRFFLHPPGAGGERRAAEAFDLSGVARDHLLDALDASLCLPVATEPHPVRFTPEHYWRGETHRLADRPDAVGRVLTELVAAGVEQVVVVSAVAELAGPHMLSTRRGTLHGRLSEQLAASEAGALRDAAAARAASFKGLFLIRPAHNPVGPLDFDGCYDERSDRRYTVAELVDRGYEDAYRQFIDPVVGAGGERLAVTGRG
jgi:hypothetical protein